METETNRSPPNTPQATLVYVTTPNRQVASAIAHAAVEEKLAACANILPEAMSVFRWEGTVREEAETVLLLKTTEARQEALFSAIRSLHPYTCPCIVAWPLASGHAGFLQWIGEECLVPGA